MVLLSVLADHGVRSLNLQLRKCGFWAGAGFEAKSVIKVAGLIPGCW